MAYPLSILGFIKRFSALEGTKVSASKLKNAITALQKEAKKGSFKGKPHVGVLRKLQKETIAIYNTMDGKKQQAILLHFSHGLLKELSACKQPKKTVSRRNRKTGKKEEALGKVKTFKPKKSADPTKSIAKKQVISAKELGNMRFTQLPFTGRWKEFIGQPSKGFYLIIYALPKRGKSYLSFQLAKYMTKYGSCLYCLAEEGFGFTAQKKMKESGIIASDKIDFSESRTLDALRKELTNKHYDTVIVDSINVFKIEPDEFEEFRKAFPKTNFINIMQATKGGNFRGSQEWTHNADSVIKVEEVGHAVNNGRFGAGEFDIFQDIKPQD